MTTSTTNSTRKAPSPESLMHAASEVARVAGDVALRYFRGTLAARSTAALKLESKGDGSPVTVADRDAERAARDWIARRFPADGILGEEFGLERGDARRRWILDPIDGTKSFIRGAPLWGTLVAVADGETVLAGAAYFAPVDELVCAAPGEGAWWNDGPCRVSSVSALSQATVLTTDQRFPEHPARRAAWEALASRAAVARTWGDCYGYLLVATGRAEVMVDDAVSPWDAAALEPIVTEAGGVFTSWRGTATAFGGDAVATNAALAEEVRVALGVGGGLG